MNTAIPESTKFLVTLQALVNTNPVRPYLVESLTRVGPHPERPFAIWLDYSHTKMTIDGLSSGDGCASIWLNPKQGYKVCSTFGDTFTYNGTKTLIWEQIPNNSPLPSPNTYPFDWKTSDFVNWKLSSHDNLREIATASKFVAGDEHVLIHVKDRNLIFPIFVSVIIYEYLRYRGLPLENPNAG